MATREEIEILEYLSGSEQLVIMLPEGRELYVSALLSQIGDEDEVRYIIQSAVRDFREFNFIKDRKVIIDVN